ncbi:MAG: hypothetical protein F4219_05940 [Gammaproteobacteria bacterium]|nr:hypothetical protein [Gammaproteobacteria bacterium]
MKSLSQFHWTSAKLSALIVLTVSLSVLLHINTKAENVDNGARLASTEASTVKELEQSNQANLDQRTPAEVLDDLVKIDSTFQRTSSLYAYLDEVSENDLLDLWNRTEDIKRTSIRAHVQTTIVRKIASNNPDQALNWINDVPKIRRTPLLKALFRDWSVIKLDKAVEGAESLNGTDRRAALATILSTRQDLSSSTLIDIARELGLEEFALRQISTREVRRRTEQPSSAWDWLVHDRVDDAKQLNEFKLVASALKEEEGFDVLLQAASLFTGKNDRTALSIVIEDVIATELSDTFDFVRNLSIEERGELPSALAMAATRIDPEIALREIAAWSDDPIYVRLQQIASTTWAQNDPRGMLDKFELVPQFTRGKALDIAFTHLAYVSPQEAINYLKRANQFLSAQALLPSIIAEQWSHTDPEAALEWSKSFAGSNSELRKRLMGRVFRNLIVSDIDRAIEISGEIHSTKTILSEASYDVVVRLAKMGRLDDAIARLPMLDNNARFFAIQRLGHALVEAGEPFAALELGANIPRPDRNVMVTGPVIYFDKVFDLWATRDPKQLFEILPSLATPLLRSLAARPLLDRQKSRPVLSNESVEYAEALLSVNPLPKNLFLLELLQQDEEGLIDGDQIVLPPEMTE